MKEIFKKKIISDLPKLIFSRYETRTTGFFFTPWGVGVQKNSGVESERGARSVLSKMQQGLRVQSLVGTELG
jgi:hypothetical protein